MTAKKSPAVPLYYAKRTGDVKSKLLTTTNIISHIGLFVKPRKENKMSEIFDHPVIHEIETTGYPAGKGETVLKCPCCGEELSADDFVYTGYNGDIVGCEHCLVSHFAENMEEAYDD